MREMRPKEKLFAGTVLIAIVLVLVGVVSGDPGVRANIAILSVFIVAGPQMIMRYQEYKTLKEMEEKFPAFLHDLTELIRAGSPFHQAIITASKTDYGKLSPEIKKMGNQLTWKVPLNKVFDQFIERIRHSKRLFMSTRTIKESYVSGGDVVSTLENVAENMTTLQDIDNEKKSMLNQYVVLMYVISVIFVLVTAGINKLMIPIFKVSETQAGSEFLLMSNPCDSCSGLSCSVCSGMAWTGGSLFGINSAGIGSYYISLFFWMSMVVSICNGLVAGQISENSPTAGIKHSMIMMAITFGAFSILVRFGVLGV